MSYPVNLQALPGEILQEVFTPENMRRKRSVGSLAQLAFPKSRLALWDGSAAGEKLRLQLCSHRKLQLVLLEKALRLAQRHARHSNKPRLHCFLLGSLSVNEDEDGVTVTLDRFDPGRDQAGTTAPSALLPGDVLVPCVVQPEMPHDAVVQSEAEFHHCFKALQQLVSSRQTLDLSQLLKVKVHVVCLQQADAATFSLSWSAVCPAVPLDVQPVRAIPIIPTALLRSLTSVGRPAPPAGRQRGFLTMDQSRKLVLLLESDPKASSLPLVGLWLSSITHAYNPQVWAWSLRFMFGSALQDRVLSELGCFLLVVFGSTHRTPQFFQCRDSRPGPGAQLDFQLLTASQVATLYQQVAPVDGGALRCELGPVDPSRQDEAFRAAHSAFSRATPPAAGPSVSDQDSGVEDEDFSPRPSPSPHPPAAQARHVQPSVPELSLLIDGSFSSNHSGGQHSGPAHRRHPANRKPASPTAASSAAQPPPLPHLHSTPNSNLQQLCACCSAHNCTSIFPSPVLLPAADAPRIQQSAPLAPSSSLKASSPLASSQHYNPKHPSTPPLPPCSHPSTPPLPPCSHPSTPPLPPCSHPSTPPLPPCSHPSTPPLPPFSSQQQTPPLPPSCSYKQTPLPPCSHPSTPPLPPCSHPSTPPLPPISLAPPAPMWHAGPPSLARPPCGNPCCDKVGGVLTSDTYQLLLHQDQQLRLLQAQVQMLLEAQRKLQTSGPQVQPATPRSTASVAVGTGASLFWGQSPDLTLLQEEPEPKPDPRTPPSSSTSASTSSHDLLLHKPEDGVSCSPSDPHSTSGLQSPVLGESVSMYGPPAEQQSFYQNLMTQLSSRLQESDSRQEAEDGCNRKSPSESHHSQSPHHSQSSHHSQSPHHSQSSHHSQSPHHSQSSHHSQSPHHSQSSQLSSSERKRDQKKKRSPDGDAVTRATLRRLQQLGVAMDTENLTELDKNRIRAVEMASTLATIDPAAVVSRLSVSEATGSDLFADGSVDLSLEANAIALRYLSQSQLSRLSLGGHAPSGGGDSLLSPSNMSLATRKYMRRYGLIEEEEEDEEEVKGQEARQPLSDALNLKSLPQSQLIRELRPKMQLLAGTRTGAGEEKENRTVPVGRTGPNGPQPEGSVGNILDLSRLRQLPKLF
ncbi:SCL-interrupting locus protein homolog isoform X3 [Poeciliopsis prolifica]|uniref:SCL-interrupting locus protein homolog isoform X3 n=1 Tax=Poeciliopsis prolifica TaxID=188132 RepID=UPI0024132068|nr:SCL-interrupting locus protein homolog isoform X3 [Poeciliopsis prolifica]